MIRIPIVIQDALFTLALVTLIAVAARVVLGVVPGVPIYRIAWFAMYAGWVFGYVMGSRPMGPD